MSRSVLFYSSIERSAAVGSISQEGVNTSQVFKPGSFGAWTHIVSYERIIGGAPIYFLYDQGSRAGAIGTVKNGEFSQTKGIPAGAFGKWTHVVSTSGTLSESLLFFYDSTERAGAIGNLSAAGINTTAVLAPGSMGAWTHIASAGATLFFYDDRSGSAAIAAITSQGLSTSRTFAAGTFGKWSHIASAGSLLFFYDRDARAGAVGRLSLDHLSILRNFPPGSLARWSHVVSGEDFIEIHQSPKPFPHGLPVIKGEPTPGAVPAEDADGFKGTGGMLLFYDIDDRSGVVAALDEQGLTTVQHLKDGSFGAWTQISNDSARIDSVVALWRARQLIQQKYDTLGGYRSPLGLPVKDQFTPVQRPELLRTADSYKADFRGGTITLKDAAGAVPEALVTHKVTVTLVGLECVVRQEKEDEIYGSVGVIHGPTRFHTIYHFPDGQEYFTLGASGNRVVVLNQLVYEGPPDLLTIPCVLVEHDSGDISQYKKKVAEALAEAAKAGLEAIGVPAEAVAADQGFISDLSLGLVNAVSSVVGADDDPYNPGVLKLAANDILRINFKTRKFKRDDDPREFEYTHSVRVSGPDDGGDTGQYTFYFDVHLDLVTPIY